MKRIVFSFILITAVMTSVYAQKRKEGTPVTVSYCLPKVSFQVKVKMEYTQLIPGPYREYAQEKLGMRPEISSRSEKWEIKGIEVKPVYVPDKTTMYAMTANGEYQSVMLTLSPEGFLAGVGCGPLPISVPVQSMYYTPLSRNSGNEVSIASLKTYNPLKEVLDTNYTTQEVDGVVKRIWDPIIRYTTKTSADNRNEAVKEIYRIRSERARLIAGGNEVPDGASLELILKEFDRMEQDYLSLFMGKKFTQTLERVFYCAPEKAGENTLIFRFSEAEGVVSRKNVSAVSYSLRVDNVVVPAGRNALPEGQGQAVIYYRVPAAGDVKLFRMNEELQNFRTVVPQLGVIKTFPTEVISNEGLVLEFYPEYGSLKSVVKGKTK